MLVKEGGNKAADKKTGATMEKILIREGNKPVYVATVSKIIGTKFFTVTAWERDLVRGIQHTTITHVEGLSTRVGAVTSRELPERLNKLPAMSDVRARRVGHWHKRLRQLEQAIFRALDIDYKNAW